MSRNSNTDTKIVRCTFCTKGRLGDVPKMAHVQIFDSQHLTIEQQNYLGVIVKCPVCSKYPKIVLS